MKPSPPIPPDTLPGSAEIVIIGGGVIGTVSACFLARAGHQVLLLERGDIGAGTTSAAAAAALLQTKTSARKLQIANRGLYLLDQLHQQLEGRFEFEHSGSLLAANTPAEMALIQEMNVNLQALGLQVELLDGQQARQRMPILGETVIGGSYSSQDAQISPLELVVACADQARTLGARLATFTRVEAIETRGDRLLAVQTSAGRVATETVIDAAGVWAPHVAQMAGIRLPIQPLKGELLVTQRMPRQMQGTLIAARYLLSKSRLEQDHSGASPARSVGITLVQVQHGNFIVGSTREPAGFDCHNTYGGIQELAAQLLELAPSLADVRLLRAYAGLRPITPDGSPIISRVPQLPGLILAAGFGGDGLAMSAITAEMVTALVDGDGRHEFLPLFSFERFPTNEVVL